MMIYGSVLGSVLMILGLYLLLWGKKKDAAAASSVVVVVCCPEPKHLPVDDEEAPNTIKKPNSNHLHHSNYN